MEKESAPSVDDHARLTEWILEFGDSVRGFIFSMTRDAELAEDLTQETFCRVWRMRHKYEEQGTPKAYLFRVADRICMDYFRKNRREVTLDGEVWRDLRISDSSPLPPERLVSQEEGEQLRGAMAELSQAQQRVLSLRYFSQMSFAEIAEVMETPQNTVLSHAFRGLTNLKKKFMPDSENLEDFDVK